MSDVTSNYKSFEDLADDDGWMPPPEGGKVPVSDLEYLQNMRHSLGLELPNLKRVSPHDKTMIMVCGGPTAQQYIEDIKKHKNTKNHDIFCSNRTHDWLINNGIVPDYFFMIDPKEIKKDDIKKPQKSVKYLIAAQCNPGVFEGLKGYDVTRIFSFCGIGGKEHKDWHLAQWLMPAGEVEPICGGSMAGLRAMYLADVLGYRKVEFYGFDSCFFDFNKETGNPEYYSYGKDRQEDILRGRAWYADDADGTPLYKYYLTTPVFASQARQFVKWKRRLAWIDFKLHGDNLTSALEYEDVEKYKKFRAPKGTLITPEYRELLKQFHHDCGKFGTSGNTYLKDIVLLAGQIAKEYKSVKVLDYGSGKKTLSNQMPRLLGVKVFEYDPCTEDNRLPQSADLVVCTDVLEHVEPECIDNVLDHLQELTQKVIYISIALVPAKKTLPDGRNAHLIVDSFHDAWLPQIKKRFQICEMTVTDTQAIVIANKGRS